MVLRVCVWMCFIACVQTVMLLVLYSSLVAATLAATAGAANKAHPIAAMVQKLRKAQSRCHWGPGIRLGNLNTTAVVHNLGQKIVSSYDIGIRPLQWEEVTHTMCKEVLSGTVCSCVLGALEVGLHCETGAIRSRVVDAWKVG
jgi:hypothetical protein